MGTAFRRNAPYPHALAGVRIESRATPEGREISPADGILRYGPVKIECTHERVACKDCGATISQEGGQDEDVENVRKE
jgi:hypothetical protein